MTTTVNNSGQIGGRNQYRSQGDFRSSKNSSGNDNQGKKSSKVWNNAYQPNQRQNQYDIRRDISFNKSEYSAPNRTASPANRDRQRNLNNDNELQEAHMHDRLLFLLVKSIGKNVIVTVKSGARYSGILSSAYTESDLSISIKYAKRISTPEDTEDYNLSHKGIINTLVIVSKDLMDIEIKRVDLEKESEFAFKTDSDISSKANNGEIHERELQPWKPDTDVQMNGLEEGFSKSDDWDQFAANKELFGVQSTYKEEFYTTKLDTSHPLYKERELEAERVAKEIENQAHGGNIHLAEERGIIIDDSGVDEEDKYSGVKRSPSQHFQSSKFNKEKSPTQDKNTNESTSSSRLSKSALHLPLKDKIPSQTQKENNASKNHPSSGSSDLYPTKSLPKQEDKKSAKALDSSNDAPKSSNVLSRKKEFIDKDLIGTFKQFLNDEKERFQQKKLASYRKETDVKLNDLMKFSQSFKLKTPVPADLVPILAKDKAKQEEIVSKSAANMLIESTRSSANSSRADNSRSSSQHNSRPYNNNNKSASPMQNNGKFHNEPTSRKFNLQASEFKPNPYAANFTPGLPHSNLQSVQSSAVSSPLPPHNKPHSTSPNQIFFGNKKIPTGKRPKITDGFNPFMHAKFEFDEAQKLKQVKSVAEAEIDKVKPNTEGKTSELSNDKTNSEKPAEFHIDRAFTFAPTWPFNIDKPFSEYFTIQIEPVRPIASHVSSPRVQTRIASPLQATVPYSNATMLQSYSYGNGVPYMVPGAMIPNYDDYNRNNASAVQGSPDIANAVAAQAQMQAAFSAQGNPINSQMAQGYGQPLGGFVYLPQPGAQYQQYIQPTYRPGVSQSYMPAQFMPQSYQNQFAYQGVQNLSPSSPYIPANRYYPQMRNSGYPPYYQTGQHLQPAGTPTNYSPHLQDAKQNEQYQHIPQNND